MSEFKFNLFFKILSMQEQLLSQRAFIYFFPFDKSDIKLHTRKRNPWMEISENIHTISIWFLVRENVTASRIKIFTI